MEVYVFFTMIGLGYIASKSNYIASNPKDTLYKIKKDKKLTDNQNMYSENIIQQVRDIEREKATKMYKKSRNPSNTKVVSKLSCERVFMEKKVRVCSRSIQMP